MSKKIDQAAVQLARVWLGADERVREQQPTLAETIDDLVLSLSDADLLSSESEKEVDRKIRSRYRPITTAMVAAGVDPKRRK